MEEKILQDYQVRKSNKQKAEFTEYILNRLEKSGYDREKDITVETKWKGIFKTSNIVVGNPSKAKLYITAHYDTCSVLPFPNLMAPTNPLLFIAYQILVAVILFVLAGVMAFPFALLFDNPLITYYAYLGALLLILYHVMFGYRNKHTANDNTSGIITITKILENLPEEHRHKVCVVYFDNEEKGLFGSMHFAEKHKRAVKNKLLINLDCVGDGDNIVSMAKRKARKDENYSLLVEALNSAGTDFDGQYLCKKNLPMMFPSDQANFGTGIGICALRKSPVGMYAARIHTPLDTKCREENIEFLKKALVGFIIKIKDAE